MSSVKTIREWKIQLPKILDVTVLEKALEEEKALEKPRKSVIDILEERIKLLTITSNDVEDSNAEVVPSEEVVPQEKPIDAVVLHKEKDILLILDPYKKSLDKVDLPKLVWKDTSDKVGYQNIKNTLNSLSELRRTVDSERKTFNAPYTEVITFSNVNCSNFIGQIKSIEDILKERKLSYDDALSKEKEAEKQKKAQELLEKQKQEEALLKQQEEEKKSKIESSDFKQKFGAIIARASVSLEQKKEVLQKSDSINDSNPFGEENDLFSSTSQPKEAKFILTDKQIFEKKMFYLNAILDLDTPNADSFIKPCAVIDSNVRKIVDYINSNFSF